MVSISLVKKLGLKAEPHAKHCQINWIHQDGSKPQITERCIAKFSIVGKYFHEVLYYVVYMTICNLPLKRQGRVDNDDYFWVKLLHIPSSKVFRNLF